MKYIKNTFIVIQVVFHTLLSTIISEVEPPFYQCHLHAHPLYSLTASVPDPFKALPGPLNINFLLPNLKKRKPGGGFKQINSTSGKLHFMVENGISVNTETKALHLQLEVLPCSQCL